MSGFGIRHFSEVALDGAQQLRRTSAMLLLDVLLRYPTATLLLVMAVLCVRDGWHLQQARLGAYVGVSIAALLLTTAPQELQFPQPIFAILRLIDLPNMVLLWLFGLSLFDDDFRIGRREWIGVTIYMALVTPWRLHGLGWIPQPPAWSGILTFVASLTLSGHLVLTALLGRSEDLIESRRQLRVGFALFLGLAAVTMIGAEIIYEDSTRGPISTLRAAVTMPLAVWAVFWLSKFLPENMLFQRVAKPEPLAPQINPKDAVTHQNLRAAMEDERIYTERGLTIGKLARHLKVPEHQLRALINNGLGFRNFAAFLNSYRIDYAKTVLADPSQSRLPVLTIAMDAGYNSLAPFNRAFKSTEGITPTAFRTTVLEDLIIPEKV